MIRKILALILFAAASVAAQSASDTFQRANENPLSDGGKWKIPTGGCALQLVTNQVYAATPAQRCSMEYWGAITWPANQTSQATLGVIAVNGFPAPMVRVQTTCACGYSLQTDEAGNYYIQANMGSQGNFKNLAQASGPVSRTGDVLMLTANGTMLTATVNGIVTVQWNTQNDATKYASGSPGLFNYGTTAGISAWTGTGGNTPPPNTLQSYQIDSGQTQVVTINPNLAPLASCSTTSPCSSTVMTNTKGSTFQVTINNAPGLTIQSVAPTSGASGVVMTITGTGFASGLTSALLCPSGTTNTFAMLNTTVNSSTTANATVPQLPGSVTLPVSCDVQVTLPATASNGSPTTAILLNP